MNKLIVEKGVYHFQDLVFQKNIKTFTKFLKEVSQYFEISNVSRISYKFIYKELKNIYTFLKETQHHPNNHLLAHALKPGFEMLLNNLIIPKIVYVGETKYFCLSRIRYSDLILAVGERKIRQTRNDLFVVSYKGKAPLQIRKRKNLNRKTSWVIDFVCRQVEKKVFLSQLRYGVNFLPPIWSLAEYGLEFGRRLRYDYFNSESEYLPLEITDFSILWLPENKNACLQRSREKMCFAFGNLV